MIPVWYEFEIKTCYNILIKEEIYMKKMFKKGLIVFASAVALGGPVASTVSAQTTYDEAFFTSITEANKELSAVKVDGSISVSAVSGGQSADLGAMTFNAAFNVEPLSFAATSEINSMFLGGQALAFSAYLQDSIVYLGATSPEGTQDWTAMNLATYMDQIKAAYEQAMTQAQSNVAMQQELTQKYFDVTESDTDYVFSLKQGINADELWADITKSIDIEKIKSDALAQYEATSGEAVTDEMRQNIDQIYSVESLKQFLAFNPVIETTYNKESKLLTGVNVLLNVKPADFAGEADDLAGSFPEDLSVKVTLTFADHNQPQEITVPAEALSAEVTEPTTAE